MPHIPKDRIEIAAEKARQAGWGAHLFFIWAISTAAAALALFASYALAVT